MAGKITPMSAEYDSARDEFTAALERFIGKTGAGGFFYDHGDCVVAYGSPGFIRDGLNAFAQYQASAQPVEPDAELNRIMANVRGKA